MLKLILGIVGGLIVAFATVMGGESLVHALTGAPSVDMNDPAAVAALVAAVPTGAKLGIVATYVLAVLLGALVATRVSGRSWTAWVILGVLLAATVANFFMLPHPIWMVMASLVLMTVAGALMARSQRAAGGSTTT